MTSVAAKKMITKFEATGCSADRLRSGRPDTSATAVETVQEEMETLAGLGADPEFPQEGGDDFF